MKNDQSVLFHSCWRSKILPFSKIKFILDFSKGFQGYDIQLSFMSRKWRILILFVYMCWRSLPLPFYKIVFVLDFGSRFLGYEMENLFIITRHLHLKHKALQNVCWYLNYWCLWFINHLFFLPTSVWLIKIRSVTLECLPW